MVCDRTGIAMSTSSLNVSLYINDNVADLPQGYAPCVHELTAYELAVAFHQAYERHAPGYGYEIRPETRRFDPESPNGMLMVAVCDEIIERLVICASTDNVSVVAEEPIVGEHG